jgi:hypothetical protein
MSVGLGAPSRTEADNAAIAINGLSKQVTKATGVKRQSLLAEIKKQQNIINAYNQKQDDAKKASDNQSLQSKIDNAQAELEIAQARGQSTTEISNRLTEFKNAQAGIKPGAGAAPTGISGGEITGNNPIKTGNTNGTSGTGGSGSKTLDPKQIWIDYLTKTFKTLPDPVQKAQIDNLFTQARNGKWTEATFMEALKGTTWWQTTLPTMAEFFIQSHDPRNASGFAQKMTNYTDYVTASMEKLGIRLNDIDPITGKVIDNTKMVQGIAADAIANGWTDSQLAEHLATKSEIIFTGGGQVGSYLNDLKTQALKYGIKLDQNQLNIIQRDLLNPLDGKDSTYYMNSIKQQAIDANPWFAPQLKEGRTLYDVTSTYRNQMSTLLEVSPEDITWNDLMKKVVNKDQTGVNTFADFTKNVKQDPLWQYTRNAKETYSNTAVDLLRQFGFMG